MSPRKSTPWLSRRAGAGSAEVTRGQAAQMDGLAAGRSAQARPAGVVHPGVTAARAGRNGSDSVVELERGGERVR